MIRVSVITVCLNAATTLRATIESVLSAGEHVFEYLVIDGGSSDGTLEILAEYEPRFDGRMRWFSEPDDGLYFAMNRGIELARGTHLLFLGGDDTLVEGALERVVRSADSEGPVDLIYADVRVVELDGSTRLERGCESPHYIGELPLSMPACHQASLFSARAYRELGGFDTSFRIAADYEFYLRFSAASLSSVYVPVVVAEFSLGGVSATRGVATAQEYRLAWVKHGVGPVRAWLRMARSIFNLRIMGAVRGMSRAGR